MNIWTSLLNNTKPAWKASWGFGTTSYIDFPALTTLENTQSIDVCMALNLLPLNLEMEGVNVERTNRNFLYGFRLISSSLMWEVHVEFHKKLGLYRTVSG